MSHSFSSWIKNPINVVFDGEDPDEEILLVLRRHLIKNLGWVLISALFAVIPTISRVIVDSSSFNTTTVFLPELIFVLWVFWYLFTFGFILENFLSWFFNAYIVTNKRIVDMDFHGVLFRNISEAPLRNIEDVTHTISGAAQVVFNYGDVVIQTAAEKREFEFSLVPNPSVVQDVISDLVSKHKLRKND